MVLLHKSRLKRTRLTPEEVFYRLQVAAVNSPLGPPPLRPSTGRGEVETVGAARRGAPHRHHHCPVISGTPVRSEPKHRSSGPLPEVSTMMRTAALTVTQDRRVDLACRRQASGVHLTLNLVSNIGSLAGDRPGHGFPVQMRPRPGDDPLVGYGALAQGTALETPARSE
jgi:hypothetical protein